MAVYVNQRRLDKPAPDSALLDGTVLWRWEDGDATVRKFLFKTDADGFYLHARNKDDPSKKALMWDLVLVSDVRMAKPPKDQRLCEALSVATGNQSLTECCMDLVYRRDGIVHLTHTNLVAESPSAALAFRKSVNALAHHPQDSNASLRTCMRKYYTKVLLHASGHDRLSLNTLTTMMMLPRGSRAVSYYLSATCGINLETDDSGNQYVVTSDLTEDVFFGLVNHMINRRSSDADALQRIIALKTSKQFMSVTEFLNFLNYTQRDTRLNEALHPPVTRDQAVALMEKYSSSTERIMIDQLLTFLTSEDNMVLDSEVLHQHMSMKEPLNHYFINSSHNTYLNGHQLRSESLAEMYIQVLLTGCRCVELDCWPSGDFQDIVITHGKTLCTQVPLREVLEAINEYAFVASSYPLILSVENHCTRQPHLISHMTHLFASIFGDKLLSEPLDEFPLEDGQPLPSPEKLKGKILIKDKMIRPKGSAISLQIETISEDGLVEEEEEEEEEEEDEEEEEEKGDDFQKYLETSDDPIAEEFIRATSISAADRKVLLPSRKAVMNSSGLAMVPEKESPTGRKVSVPGEDNMVIKENGTSPQIGGKRSPEQSQLLKQPSGDSIGSSGGERKGERSPDISPYNELLIYTRAAKFHGFDEAEEQNKSYILSSFEEVKSFNLIKATPKLFVRYNQHQNSRIYPAGTRIASTNYMPQIYWNVGCQLVSLNFQTMDLPLQLNFAKFEANGGTGYILKPWALRHGKNFSPFVMEKITDVVPAQLMIKVISGMFLPSKKPNLMVEAEMFGLPADTVRHQYTHKIPGPHPHWNEDYFVFKVLLSNMALLRLAVLDDDHNLVAHRILPVSHLRTGFHHIPLRDKHNTPLGIANLFVHIKIKDHVPDQLEIFVQRMTNPTAFLDVLAEGTVDQKVKTNQQSSASLCQENKSLLAVSASPPAFLTLPRSPKHKPGQKTPVQGKEFTDFSLTTLPTGKKFSAVSHSCSQNFAQASGFGKGKVPECIQEARERQPMVAAEHDSVLVLRHPDYIKLQQKNNKQRADIARKHERAKKAMLTRQSKERAKLLKAFPDRCIYLDEQHQKELASLEAAQEKEATELDHRTKKEALEKRKWLVEVAHKAQQRSLEKLHQSDIRKVNLEVDKEMKRRRREGQYLSSSDGMRFLIEEMVTVGKNYRAELDEIHQQEMQRFEDSAKERSTKMNELYQQELALMST